MKKEIILGVIVSINCLNGYYELHNIEKNELSKIQTQYKGKGFLVLSILFLSVVSVLSYIAILN